MVDIIELLLYSPDEVKYGTAAVNCVVDKLANNEINNELGILFIICCNWVFVKSLNVVNVVIVLIKLIIFASRLFKSCFLSANNICWFALNKLNCVILIIGGI